MSAVAFMVFPLKAAVLPEFAPGMNDLPQRVRDAAALLWILCWLPALGYTLTRRERRRPIPFFPIIGILYGLYYALSAALGFANYWGRDPVNGTAVTTLFNTQIDYGHPVEMAFLGWAAMLLGRHIVLRSWHGRMPPINARLRRLRARDLLPWTFVFLALNAAQAIVGRVTPFDPSHVGALRMISFVAQAALIVLIVAYRANMLTRRQRILTWVAVPAAVFIDFGSGATAPVLYVSFAIFTAFWIGRRGMPVRYLAAGAVAVLLCVSIRGVMNQWRLRVWRGGSHVSPLQQSWVLVDLLEESVRDRGVQGTIARGWDVIARRSSNIELLADVMRRTPADVPFWDGATYNSLVGAFVPRVVWPDKPTKTLGQDFGHRYGYLSPLDGHTSINLPVLVEFYINYGDPGILLGMLLVGAILATLEQCCNRPGQSVLMTAAAAPIMTQFYVMECDFSLQYGGLVLQLVVMLALALVLFLRYGPRRRPWWDISPTLHVPSLR